MTDLPKVGAQAILEGVAEFKAAANSVGYDVEKLNLKFKLGSKSVSLSMKKMAEAVQQNIDKTGSSLKSTANVIFGAMKGIASTTVEAMVITTTAIASAHGAMVALGTVSGINAAKFEFSMARAGAITQGTSKQMESLGKEVIRISRVLPESIGDINMAVNELARGGIGIEDMLNGALEAVVRFSVASGGELGLQNAAIAAARGMTTFGLSGK